MTLGTLALDLPIIWALLIAFAIFAYVVLDGFDLGIGLLSPLLGDEAERDLAVNTVAPVWDGNETWLVLGGGGLFAVFPLAYAILLPAFYAPLIAMLIGLILRGVAFEFRWKSAAHKPAWDIAFAGGSLIATLAQGLMLGAFIQGIAIDGRAYAGGWFDWLTPFSVATSLALAIGYALLGANWIILKTEGPLRERAYRMAKVLAVAFMGALAIVSAWTPFLNAVFMERWFAWPAIVYTAPVPIATAAAALLLFHGLYRANDYTPFLATLVLFLLCYIGLAISLYPHIVPPGITIWQAAAPDSSLAFLLVGTAVLVPLILAYTAYAYWVFRGKIDPDEGYH